MLVVNYSSLPLQQQVLRLFACQPCRLSVVTYYIITLFVVCLSLWVMVLYRQYRLRKNEEERQTMFTLISKVLGKQFYVFYLLMHLFFAVN